MARPLSEEKRLTILQAATELFAREGLSSSTAKIAKLAKVSEGTIFTYFNTKDELLNGLYIELKSKLRSTLVMPVDASDLQSKMQVAWNAYINWGIAYPNEHKVLAMLGLSGSITTETKEHGRQAFIEVLELIEIIAGQGPLRNQSIDYVGAIMAAIADVTIAFITQSPQNKKGISEDGYSVFWRAVS